MTTGCVVTMRLPQGAWGRQIKVTISALDLSDGQGPRNFLYLKRH